MFILTQRVCRLAAITAIFLLLQLPAQAGTSALELELYGGHDSNPSRGQAGNGVGAENIQGARATLLRSVLLDERSGIIFRGVGRLERHAAYPGLNNLRLNAGASYRIQPTVGYAMPWYELSLDLERRQYANSAIRNGSGAVLGLSVGKHFTDRIYSTAGVDVRRDVADRESLYDLTERRLFAAVGYRFGLENTFFLNLARTKGDQVFGARESYGVSGTVKASADDPAFGEGYYAYRMDAVSTVAEAGVDLPLRGNTALGIRAKRSHSQAYGGQAYAYTLMQLSWRYRFY